MKSDHGIVEEHPLGDRPSILKVQMTEIRRESLSDQVGQYLLALIREQNLKPGDTLPSEASLINRFQVSRPVIREALVQLKSLGIIETKSGKRPVVRSLDSRLLSIFFEYVLALNDAKVFELLEARRGIEIQSASLAAQRRTTAEIKKMQGILGQMKACLVKRDINGYVDLDVELHLQIAEASRNSLIYLLIEAIREPL
jgi:DNA-binding FadR family transcriptional regulator